MKCVLFYVDEGVTLEWEFLIPKSNELDIRLFHTYFKSLEAKPQIGDYQVKSKL